MIEADAADLRRRDLLFLGARLFAVLRPPLRAFERVDLRLFAPFLEAFFLRFTIFSSFGVRASEFFVRVSFPLFRGPYSYAGGPALLYLPYNFNYIFFSK